VSGQAYVGTAKRTFAQAVLHLLETQYGVLNSRRVLQLLASDVEQLAEQFYPQPEHLASGWMIFTGTRATGGKAHPGQSASDHELATLAWPVLTREDIQTLATLPMRPTRKDAYRAWMQRRLARIVNYGWDHPQGPVVLTLADLSAIVGISTVEVSQLLTEARRSTGQALATKGYYFDQGMRPTHKADIIGMYEAGADEAQIARRSQHAQASVGHYIRQYERVKLLLKHHTLTEDIGRLLNMQPNVVQAHLELVKRYHPELLRQEQPAPLA